MKNVEKFLIVNDGIPAVVESIFAIHLSKKNLVLPAVAVVVCSHTNLSSYEARQSYYTKQCSEWNIGESTDPVRGERARSIYAENISNMNNNFFRFTSIIKNDLYSCKKREEEDPPVFEAHPFQHAHENRELFFYFPTLSSSPRQCR